MLLASCGGSSSLPARDNIIQFTSRDAGIRGSYKPSDYAQPAVQKRVGELACTSGRLAAYQQTPMEGGGVEFLATCAGGNRFEGVAGFTVNDIANSGHITASVDGRLVQIKL